MPEKSKTGKKYKKRGKKKKDSKGNPYLILSSQRTFEQKAADDITNFVGSWAFIFFLVFIMGVWMMVNVFASMRHWDPYPFILLNLALSCLAAIQAPLIMMSQNRQAERDRIRANYDYHLNRKAEREIRKMQGDINKIKRVMGGKK
jgi:uncharacterized membrane protein